MPAKGAALSHRDDHTSPPAEVAVVGGGVIGLAIAFRAQQRGLSVVVLDRGDESASNHAAGMLAPVSEAEVGHAELLDDGLEAARAWPAFARELGVALHQAG